MPPMTSPEKKKRKKKDPSLTLQSTPDPPISSLKKKRKTTVPKKKKKPSPTPQSTSIMSLPDDLLLKCLARVSRLYYPTLSLVSKMFRSLVVSPELHKVRSLLGHTGSCLYVCFGDHSDFHLFTLCWIPDKTLTNKALTNDTGYFLTKVPIPSTRCADFSNLVAVGSDIYKIGESSIWNQTPSSSVSILDCRSHTWREGPRLRLELLSLTATVIDRKIYVAGCCKDGDSNSLKNSFHVLDTTTHVWDPEPIPCREAENDFLYSKSACVDGKLHVKSTILEEVAYNYKEGRWDLVGRVGDRFVRPAVGNYLSTCAYCEIGSVFFCVDCGVIGWCDTEVSKNNWRLVEGLVGLPELFPENCVRLADYGGKMAVFWQESWPLFPYGYDLVCGD